MDKPPWYIYKYDMIYACYLLYKPCHSWSMKCIDARDSVPRKLAKGGMEAANDFFRIQRRIYWEKHMDNGDHLASLTTVALCLTVC